MSEPNGPVLDPFDHYRADITAIADRVAGEVVLGRRAVALAVAILVLVAAMALPIVPHTTGWWVVTHLAGDQPAVRGVARAFTVLAVFSATTSALAWLTRRWVIALLAALACGSTGALGYLAVWSQATNPAVEAHPTLAMLVACLDTAVLAVLWLPIVCAPAQTLDSHLSVDPPAPSRRRHLLFLAAATVGVTLGALATPLLRPEASSVPAASSVDVGFAQDFTARELQAVEIAWVAAVQTDDPAIRPLAYDIATTRQNQAGWLQGWLTLWQQPSLPPGPHLGWMGGAAVDDMPGMPSNADRAEQRRSRGQATDRLFLSMMRNLDLGGLGMLGYTAAHAETSAVREFAVTAAAQQQRHADLVAQLLAEHTASSSPPN